MKKENKCLKIKNNKSMHFESMKWQKNKEKFKKFYPKIDNN